MLLPILLYSHMSVCELMDCPASAPAAALEQEVSALEARLEEVGARAEREVAKVARRMEALATAVHQLNMNSNAVVEKRLKSDVGFLETVVRCLHQCFHDEEV